LPKQILILIADLDECTRNARYWHPSSSPEPPRDVGDQPVARGNKFFKSVGMASMGDAQAVIGRLLGRVREN
jgi:hypothetical protein